LGTFSLFFLEGWFIFLFFQSKFLLRIRWRVTSLPPNLRMSIQEAHGDENRPLLPVSSWPSQDLDGRMLSFPETGSPPPELDNKEKIEVVCILLYM
jgi:hypothetical protein